MTVFLITTLCTCSTLAFRIFNRAANIFNQIYNFIDNYYNNYYSVLIVNNADKCMTE